MSTPDRPRRDDDYGPTAGSLPEDPNEASDDQPNCLDLHETYVDGIPVVPRDHWGQDCPHDS